MPNFLMFSRLPIMLMPYLVLYRLSRWFSLSQGKLSHEKQYLTVAFTIFSQFLILHATQDFDLRLSSPRQPGHGFLSLVNARQRRQFIPQGAISFVGIAVVFVDLFDVMIRSGRSYVRTYYLSPTTKISFGPNALLLFFLIPQCRVLTKHTSSPVKESNPEILIYE